MRESGYLKFSFDVIWNINIEFNYLIVNPFINRQNPMKPNGPVVWVVAVGACPERSEGSGLACVFANPDGYREQKP
jgi:hypothetical protein